MSRTFASSQPKNGLVEGVARGAVSCRPPSLLSCGGSLPYRLRWSVTPATSFSVAERRTSVDGDFNAKRRKSTLRGAGVAFRRWRVWLKRGHAAEAPKGRSDLLPALTILLDLATGHPVDDGGVIALSNQRSPHLQR